MRPLCIAHRGKHDIYFENTLEAFESAAHLPFYGIETDVHLSKDKKWVIHHNPDIISNGQKFLIKEYTYEQLKEMPLDNNQGHLDACVCLLSDFLKICKENNKRPIIELKISPTKEEISDLAKMIEEIIGLKNVTIISFFPEPLIKLRKYKVHRQLLICDQHFKMIRFIGFLYRLDIDIEYHLLTKNILKRVHRRHHKVNVWCPDDINSLKEMINLGVDYVTTNTFNQDTEV